MAVAGRIGRKTAMATRWRRRRMCVLVAGGPSPAALREVSASGAFVETNARPDIGSRVELRHPEAGELEGGGRALAADGVQLPFVCSEASVAFAMAAIAADMTRT